MKIISATVMIFILFELTGQGQGLYSKENLENASKDDLSLLLTQSQKLKKTGGAVTVAGSSAALIGILLMAAGESSAYPGIGLFLAGVIGTAIGIPMITTGASRVKKVSNIFSTKYSTSSLELTPFSQYNYQTRNFQSGISLRIRF